MAQSDEQKAADAAEKKRRAALTDDQRALEDRAAAAGLSTDEMAELQKLEEDDLAQKDPAARLRQLQAKRAKAEKAQREKDATVDAVVAPGRELYLAHDQTEPHRGGDMVKLTPAEYARLVSLGHVRDPEGHLVERNGPKVLEEAGLIQGHGTGQGTKPGK